MAKGFKVIPKETPKKETWDYDKIKERVKESKLSSVFQAEVVLILF